MKPSYSTVFHAQALNFPKKQSLVSMALEELDAAREEMVSIVKAQDKAIERVYRAKHALYCAHRLEGL